MQSMRDIVIVDQSEDVTDTSCDDFFATIPRLRSGSRSDVEFHNIRVKRSAPSLNNHTPQHLRERFVVLEQFNQQVIVDVVVHRNGFDLQLAPD
jgi:hypothetical protein